MFLLIELKEAAYPFIISGPKLTYLNPQQFIMFFKPIDINMKTDEYISSICITHEADIPNSSSIVYGFTQSETLDPSDYTMFNPDQHIILPTRYNEMLLTDDYKVYTALNGRWSSTADVQVYRINDQLNNGLLVDSSLYSVNSAEGTITFTGNQSKFDTFIICIGVIPSFRLIAQISNYGTESAIIHYVNAIYNITKRIPTDSFGNILNKPINMLV